MQLDPFPHLVIDDFFSEEIVKLLVSEFPEASDPRWQRFENDREKKLGGTTDMWGPVAHAVGRDLTSPARIRWLEKQFGIPDLTPDFTGGGMHMIETGGVLDVHVDFNRLRGLYRRLNLLVYLNPMWDEEWGGDLHLCRPDGEVVERISPLAGRAVIFATSDKSYHGHPEPLSCPPGIFRRSFACYFYSPVPADGAPDHSTEWLESASSQH